MMEGVQPAQKFTDEELVEEYNFGHSDRMMARRLNVSKTSIIQRRYKLGLVAKPKKQASRILNKKQMERSLKNMKNLRKSRKYPLLHRKAVAKWKQNNPEKVKENDRKQYLKRKEKG